MGPKPSIEISGGEDAVESESHVGSEGSAEDGEDTKDGHGIGDKGLSVERENGVEDSG